MALCFSFYAAKIVNDGRRRHVRWLISTELATSPRVLRDHRMRRRTALYWHRTGGATTITITNLQAAIGQSQIWPHIERGASA